MGYDSEDKIPGDIQAAIDAGKAISSVRQVEVRGVPFTAVSEGVVLTAHPELCNDPDISPAPRRLRGCQELEEPDSFCEFVEQFRNAAMRLYGDPDKYFFTAIFNDQDLDSPAWRDHKAVLQLKFSPEWNEWMAASNEYLSQQALADFFDDHMDQIASPSASDLLSDIRSLKITNNTKYTSVQHEGGDIVFEVVQETAATTNTSRGKVPAQLVLFIAPFRTGKPIQMTVNLSYRFSNGQLSFKLKPVTAEQHIQHVFHDVRTTISEKLKETILI